MMAKARSGAPGSAEREELVDKVLAPIRQALIDALGFNIGLDNDIRELSIREMIERGLMDGYVHYESTGKTIYRFDIEVWSDPHGS